MRCDMENERYILIHASKYDIAEPEFFDTYIEAHEAMKRQYEIFSKGCIGELNDDNAWCVDDDCITNWKIFDILVLKGELK